jgi:type II secretory pathway pseudopilin PulG
MALISTTARRTSRKDEHGYILLTLMLMVALMIIGAAIILPTITFEIRRDREEEMIHRGVQYSRAIRQYYKKFGRYPTRIEDLESSNNLRFLRKRYKDPMNCKAGKCEDFKFLHFGEVKLTFSGGVPGGTIPGATPAGGDPGAQGVTTGPVSPGQLGQVSNLGGNSFGSTQGITGDPGNSSTPGATPNPPPGQNTPGGGDSGGGQPSVPQQGAGNQNPGTDATAAATPVTGASGLTSLNAGGQAASSQVLGGGAIVGVVSANKKDTIREFNHKKKYNEWQFIYDPGTDTGGLLMTPNQPPLLGVGQNVQNGNQGPNAPTGIQPIQNTPGNLDQNPQNPQNSPIGPGNYYKDQ